MPAHDLSFQRLRLRTLQSQLRLLFADVSCAPGEQLFYMKGGDSPYLLISEAARVSIAPNSGLYVFSQSDEDCQVTTVTASQDCVIEHVVTHLSQRGKNRPAQAVEKAVHALVGRSFEEVERQLILQTVQHCDGNRTHAAILLGISLRTIRNKLKSYWQASGPAGEQQSSAVRYPLVESKKRG
jgi:DNA-binding protein Fis